MLHGSRSDNTCVFLNDSQLVADRLKLSCLLRLKIADKQAIMAFAHTDSVAVTVFTCCFPGWELKKSVTYFQFSWSCCSTRLSSAMFAEADFLCA